MPEQALWHETDEKLNQTRQRLIECGKAEFLEKDYQHASLRKICKAAGVTTGAFYFSFENKEALFRKILEPVIEQYNNMTNMLSELEMENPETSVDNDRKMMEFAYRHKEEVLILMEHAQGSCYENFNEYVREMMVNLFRRHFAYQSKTQPNEDLIRILTDMRIQSSLAILKGNYDMDYTFYLVNAIGCYADSGTEKLINKIKEDVHRK